MASKTLELVMTFFDTFLINLRFFASSNKSDHTRSPYKYNYNIYTHI